MKNKILMIFFVYYRIINEMVLPEHQEEANLVDINMNDISITLSPALDENTVEYNKYLCYDNVESKCSLVITTLFLAFLIVLIAICNASIITIDKTEIIISPFVDPSDYYTDSALIIKPCIYGDIAIMKYNATCLPDYDYVPITDICQSWDSFKSPDYMQYICLLKNINSLIPSPYPPDCYSIANLHNLYENYEIYNNNIKIEIDKDEGTTTINTMWLIFAFITIFSIVIQIYVPLFSGAKYKFGLCDRIKLCYLIFLPLSMIAVAILFFTIKNGTLLTTEIISINCSNINIYENLSFVQKIFVSNQFRWWTANLSYDNMIYYFNIPLNLNIQIMLFLLPVLTTLYCAVMCLLRLRMETTCETDTK